MHKLMLFAALFLCACSSAPRTDQDHQPLGETAFADTNGDGLPDVRVHDDRFMDTDNDGLPDRRRDD